MMASYDLTCLGEEETRRHDVEISLPEAFQTPTERYHEHIIPTATMPAKVNFLHIPKAGGTTFEQISLSNGHKCGLWGSRLVGNETIRQQYGWGGGFFWQSFPLLEPKRGSIGKQQQQQHKFPTAKNCTCAEWHTPLQYLPNDIRKVLYPNSKTFCVVREPLERLVSFYYYHHWRQACKDPTAENMNKILYKDLTIALRERPCHYMCHLLPQHYYMKGKNDEFGCDRALVLGPTIFAQFNSFMETETSCPIRQVHKKKSSNAKDKRMCDGGKSVPKLLTVSDLSAEVTALGKDLYEEDFALFEALRM